MICFKRGTSCGLMTHNRDQWRGDDEELTSGVAMTQQESRAE
jgi:hypothetical protein